MRGPFAHGVSQPRYLRAFAWSFLASLLFFTVCCADLWAQALAVAAVLLWALAEVRRLRQDCGFLRLHRDQLAYTLALVAKKRGRA